MPEEERVDKGKKGEVTQEQQQEIEVGEFLTVSEVADKLRYSYQWVLWMLQEGRIRGIKPLGSRWRIPRSEFEKILKDGVPAPIIAEPEKPAVTEIAVGREVESKVLEPVEKKKPPSAWPLDFSSLFGGDKK
ncbi:MAG: helix-turn-helix domain-containing protein [Deltaproteobacteria bacterium]|nr:helix-turn-helix domain-containing protein [Deltaproteobacteria bacterium]MBW2632236.1 helix-turn-helix domain-containing protein [Deltaproteobacteria bacterium]